jgi:nicotinate-nucleotide pyrophosphorylase (carboxylating)
LRSDKALFDSEVERIAATALAEDGTIDLTTQLIVPPTLNAHGLIEYRSEGLLAGQRFAEAVAAQCDCTIEWRIGEGGAVRSVAGGSVVGTMFGELRQMLRAERPLLNLLQRASGIASATRRYVDAVHGTGCRILHTRKTAPGLRALDVAGVLAGGGHRHRMDLAHEVMIKDNHWQSLERTGQPLAEALADARRKGATALYVEVESVEQLELACQAGATRLLIDNQSPETLAAWAALAQQRSPGIEIEASGGIVLDTARAYAAAGADFISIGALTHSVRAADIALEVRVEADS